MSEQTIEAAVLDHVAHAVPRWQDVWTRYAVELGAEWSSGGPGPGFAPGQLRFANGARVEVLMPFDIHVNDFLHRFIANSGPGPHHLTFKVPDLGEAIEKARRVGLEPIGIDLSDPDWIEAFLHPKEATGVVVQLAQAPSAWSSPPPDGYPTDRRRRRDGSGPVVAASLLRVTHAVSDFDAAHALFVGLLGGTVIAQGHGSHHRWADLAWGGPLGLRLVSPTDPSSPGELVQWLGGRTGRIHHLELTVEEPDGLPGAEPVGPSLAWIDADSGGHWVIEPEDNQGLRLVLRAT
jgi:methylmalonyl-CoA/ethylmalonyl-CoA epimerase